MGFWGMSSAGKQAQGNMTNLGNWNFQQYKDALDRMNNAGINADAVAGSQKDYWTGRMGNGFGTPGGIRSIGEDISPGTDAAIYNRQQILNDKAGRIDPFAEQIQGEINSGAGTLMDRNNQVSGDIIGNTNSVYDSARDQNNIVGKANMDSIESLNPASEATQARVGRSFAPALAATAGRLRRSGVDPNSVQASSVIGNVEAQRARAMDDAAASGTAGYVAAKNSERDKSLSNDTALATQSLGLVNNERVRSLGTANSIDSNRTAQTIANDQDRFNALNQNSNDQAGEQLTALGLKNDQFDRGAQFQTQDQASRDAAAGQVGQIGRDWRQAQFGYGDQARGFGGDANQQYGQVYQNEAANAGWGAKMLGGIAGAALGGGFGTSLGKVFAKK